LGRVQVYVDFIPEGETNLETIGHGSVSGGCNGIIAINDFTASGVGEKTLLEVDARFFLFGERTRREGGNRGDESGGRDEILHGILQKRLKGQTQKLGNNFCDYSLFYGIIQVKNVVPFCHLARVDSLTFSPRTVMSFGGSVRGVMLS
jgi:hypothetical protein